MIRLPALRAPGAQAPAASHALHARSSCALSRPLVRRVGLPARRADARTPGQACRAHPRRVAKVAKQLEREIANMLLFDRRLRDAVCPERKRGGDSALSGMASVTEVVLSGDLQVAKVYISILSDQEGKEVAMENLRKLQPYVRMRVGKSLRLRLTPEIRLIPDESIERAMRVLKLLDQIKEGDDGATAREPPPIAIPGDDEEGGFFDMYEDEDSFDEEYAEFEGPTNLFDEEGGESVESGGGFVGSAAGGEDDDEEDQEARALDDIFKSYREQRRQAQVGGYSRPVPARRTEEEVIPEKFGGASLQEVSGGGVLDVADLAELDDLDVSQRKPWSRKRGSWNRNRTGGGGGGGGGRRRRR